jgi:hypothetical protein
MSAVAVVISAMSHLFPVRFAIEQWYFCMTPMRNTDLLESVGGNFDVNFVMKEFAADRQFIIW